MSVTAIRLKNFMGFEDTDWIELRSICLLFGANSSGKSAIIRALRLLKQSLDTDENSEPLVFFTESQADFGTFKEMIRGHQIEEKSDDDSPRPRQMVFGFRCPVPAQTFERIVGVLDGDEQSSMWNTEFSLHFQWNTLEERVELSAVSIEIPVSPESVRRQTVFEWFLAPDLTPGWYLGSYFGKLFNDQEEELIEVKSDAGLFPTLRSKKATVSDKAISDRCDAIVAVFGICSDAIKKFLRNIRYLGPIRFEPQRFYFLPQMAEKRWEQQGMGTLRDYLLMSADTTKRSLLMEVNYWIRKLGLGDYVEIEQLVPGRSLVCQIMFGDEAIDEVVIRDVGYGASQALPIVLQSLFAPSHSLVIIEQPEVHLHPNAQVALTDLFIKQIQDNQRFLIETHSEHLLLRIQRRIAETTYDNRQRDNKQSARNQGFSIGKENFGLIFVRRDAHGSFTECLQTDEVGTLQAPSMEFQYFFKSAYDQVIGLTSAKRDIKNLGADYAYEENEDGH